MSPPPVTHTICQRIAVCLCTLAIHADTGSLARTVLNRDTESVDMADYFVVEPGSTWRYEAFDENLGRPENDATGALTWRVDHRSEPVHGVDAARLVIEPEDEQTPYAGLINLYSIDGTRRLLNHGLTLTQSIRRPVEYLGNTYTLVVQPQTIVFDEPLVIGTVGMTVHEPLRSRTSATVKVKGIPFVNRLPLTIVSTCELLGVRARKRTPLGVFLNVPYFRMTISATTIGQSLQEQGGVLYMAAGRGVICQNALDQPESALGMALVAGTIGDAALTADDPLDRVYQAEVRLQAGWNLISFPLQPGDPTPRHLVADRADIRVWEWQHDAYRPAQTIRPGRGYWLHLPTDALAGKKGLSLVFRGTLPRNRRRAVRRGWILTGPVGASPDARMRLPLPYADRNGHAARIAWAYADGALCPRKTLHVGEGAWLFIEAPGAIDLSSDE